jgi:hypothetical protein
LGRCYQYRLSRLFDSGHPRVKKNGPPTSWSMATVTKDGVRLRAVHSLGEAVAFSASPPEQVSHRFEFGHARAATPHDTSSGHRSSRTADPVLRTLHARSGSRPGGHVTSEDLITLCAIASKVLPAQRWQHRDRCHRIMPAAEQSYAAGHKLCSSWIS